MSYEATWNHDLIRRWALRHGAIPAACTPAIVEGKEPVLTFLFSGVGEEGQEASPISWAVFFAQFDLSGLCFTAEEQGSPLSFRLFCDPTYLFGM